MDMFTDEERKILSVCPGITDWALIEYNNEGDILKGAKDPPRSVQRKD